MAKERITIVGLHTDSIIEVEDRWSNSIMESRKALPVGYVRVNIDQCEVTPYVACQRAWEAHDTAVLAVTDEYGDEIEFPVIAVRQRDEQNHKVLSDFWLQLPEN